MLSVVLVIAPGQASALTAARRCAKDAKLCLDHGLLCRECYDLCTAAAKTGRPAHRVYATHWAWFCGKYKR